MMDEKTVYELLRKYLDYDPTTGTFSRRVNRGRYKAGTIAGCVATKAKHITAQQYLVIMIAGKLYYAHRLAWLYMTGRWPKEQIDHIDGDGLNNKWSNLRQASHLVNQRNKSINSNNTSGCTGVWWDKEDEKWQASIRHNEKRIYLGRFKNLEEAVTARKSAEAEYGYHKNHGRPT